MGTFYHRGEESKFVLVASVDGNLVIATLRIKTDEEKLASRVAKVVNGIFAAGNGVLEGQCDTIELTVRNTHTPDKVIDVIDVLLVGLMGEDDKGAPGAVTFADPSR